MKLICILSLVYMFACCKTPAEQAATTPKPATATQPAIAKSSKDTTTKNAVPHARHRDEPIRVDNGGGQPAKPYRTEPVVTQPVKRTESSAAKPSAKQTGTFTPATLKNAPKPNGN